MAVVLEHQISVQVHGLAGGLSARRLGARRPWWPRWPQPLATAFGDTFWWVLAMTVLALVPALLLSRVPAGQARSRAPGRRSTDPGPAPAPSTVRAGRGRSAAAPARGAVPATHARYSRVLTVKRVP